MMRNKDLIPWVSGLINNKDIRIIANISAFFHDIGKGGDGIINYYDKSTHPTVGKEYVMGEREYRIVATKKKLNIANILIEMGIPKQRLFMIGAVAQNHWLFGNILKHIKNTEEIISAAYSYFYIVYQNVYKMKSSYDEKDMWGWFPTLINIIMLISACDVYGASPYRYMKIVGNIDEFQYINRKSEVFPYLSNRPQNHRGKSNFTSFRYDTVGIQLRNVILEISNVNTLRLDKTILTKFMVKNKIEQ
jgi:hypothetical protein